MLESRRDVETLRSAVCELRELNKLLTITQTVQQVVAAVSVLTESSELLESSGGVDRWYRTVDELKGSIEVVQRQLVSVTQLSASICKSTQEGSPTFIQDG